jgi:hypothetical protein
MTAKTSAEMKEALRLIRTGMRGREAAKQAGVREESLYRHPDYKAYRQAVRAGKKESK